MPEGTIDLSALENLFEGDRARVREWIAIYLEEAPPLFRKLAECQESGDTTGLVSLAHDLRPLAYYLGVPRVLDLLSDIGQRARTGGAATCDALVRELITFSGNAEAELRAFAAQP